MSEESAAMLEIAAAIRELAAAIKGPDPEPEPEYRCAHCGSPKWEEGGMGLGFKKCLDCGELGGAIEPGDTQP